MFDDMFEGTLVDYGGTGETFWKAFSDSKISYLLGALYQGIQNCACVQDGASPVMFVGL